MHRRELAPDEGMLFVCDEPSGQQFWMKDTPLPLSIAFLDASGVILRLREMQPNSLEPHSSVDPVRFILEMGAGWFEDRGIARGCRIAGPPFVTGPAAAGGP